MSGTREEAERVRISAEAEAVAALYDEMGGLLERTCIERFSVPPDEAAALVHEVFLSFVAAGRDVTDPKAWLIAAVCQTATAPQRPPIATSEEDAALRDALALRQIASLRAALSTISGQSTEAIRLRYQEHLSYAEIAERLNVSEFYVRAMIRKAMTKLRHLTK